jgi:hypothetical protein
MQAWAVTDEWLDLIEQSGAKAGSQVRVHAFWTPNIKEPEQPLTGSMTLTIFEASDLKSVDTFGSNDVFIRVRVPGAEAEQQTPTLDGAGAQARWNGESGHVLTFDVSLLRAHWPPPLLEITAFDENVGSADVLIGGIEIELEHTADDAPLSLDNWYELSDKRQKAAGIVHMGMAWVPSPENVLEEPEPELVELVDGTLLVTVSD